MQCKGCRKRQQGRDDRPYRIINDRAMVKPQFINGHKLYNINRHKKTVDHKQKFVPAHLHLQHIHADDRTAGTGGALGGPSDEPYRRIQPSPLLDRGKNGEKKEVPTKRRMMTPRTADRMDGWMRTNA